MANDTLPADEHDIPWKEAIEGAFPEFMAFYFPAAHAIIDWMLQLPKPLEQQVWQGIETIEGKAETLIRQAHAPIRPAHRFNLAVLTPPQAWTRFQLSLA